MATPRKKYQSGASQRKPMKRAAMRADILHEWFGCDKPLNLTRNVSEAGEWVDDILREQFLTENISEEELKIAWKEVAGDFIGNATIPDSVKNGELLLRVNQPAMRFHLNQMKAELLRKIQSQFSSGKIKSIRFIHG